MSTHLNRPRTGDNYHIIGSQGFVAGSQQNVVQHNTFGLDPAALHDFAALVLQLAPTLGVTPEQEAQLIKDAEVLSTETTRDAMEPGRIRVAYERLQARLEGITKVTVALTMLIEQGQKAVQTVFGG